MHGGTCSTTDKCLPANTIAALAAGGELLRPCSCRGSLAFIHVRCLREWAASQQQQADLWRAARLRCEICKAPYKTHSLAGAVQRPSLVARGRRAALALRDTVAGRAYVLGGAVCGVAGCLGGAFAGVAHTPALLHEARRSGPSALLPLAKQLAVGSLLSPITGLGLLFYLQAAAFYLAGWGLDAACCRIGASLPTANLVGRALTAALWGPRLAGMSLEAFHLALLSFLGGLHAGFVRGVCNWVVLPCILVPRVLRAAAGAAWRAWSLTVAVAACARSAVWFW